MAMLSSLYLSYYNLGDYLRCLNRSVSLTKSLVPDFFAGNRKQIENCNDDQTTRPHGSGGCWQSPLQDIMEGILPKMGLIARTRSAKVCMSWSSLKAMRADLRSAPELPWLVHPQAPNTNYLTFSSLSDGDVVNLELPNPKRNQGRGKFKFQASSRGWLIMLEEKGLTSFDMFLYHPISKAQHQLPSLNTVPSFLYFRSRLAAMLFKWTGITKDAEFVNKIVLSSPNISDCVVAAVIDFKTKLALCRPGDKSWTVFELETLIPDEDNIFIDLLFSQGVLYGLVNDLDKSKKNAVGESRILNYGDDRTMTLELKFVYGHDEVSNAKEDHDAYEINFNSDSKSYLVESVTNSDKEILLIHQMLDCFVADDLDTEYQRTRGFVVYRIDFDSGNFREVKNLGDQILFLAEHSNSLSFPASDFKLQGNCIYFATSGYESTSLRLPGTPLERNLSREIGIFSLEDGKIKRPFPSLDVVNPLTCKLCWFSLTLSL